MNLIDPISEFYRDGFGEGDGHGFGGGFDTGTGGDDSTKKAGESNG